MCVSISTSGIVLENLFCFFLGAFPLSLSVREVCALPCIPELAAHAELLGLNNGP